MTPQRKQILRTLLYNVAVALRNTDAVAVLDDARELVVQAQLAVDEAGG